MRLWRLVMIIAVAAAIPVLAFSATARASGHTNICGNGGTGYCLNDWGGNTGNGAPVKMYYGGYTNDDFGLFTVNACNGGYILTSSCLSTWGSNNTGYVGGVIYEIYNENASGRCIATDAGARAVMGTCADGNGNNGSNGVLMVSVFCGNGIINLGDRYWSHIRNAGEYLDSGGQVGAQAFFGNPGTCWGYVNSSLLASGRTPAGLP